MKVLSVQQMRNLDKKTIEELGISGLILMENAGRMTAQKIMEHFGHIIGDGEIVIIAGKGNNGGDGFVVARHLHNMGKRVKVILIPKRKEVTGDADVNLKILEKLKFEIIYAEGNYETIQKHLIENKSIKIVVDAIFGTGLDSEVKGIYRDVIELINSLNVIRVAVDIPSGLSGDKGIPLGVCVHAHLTVTFGLPKMGLLTYPGREYVGILEIADIGFPKEFIEEIEPSGYLLDEKFIRSILKPREKNTHKGTYGHLLAICGSIGKTGAACLTALGGIKSGAGLVTLAVPESIAGFVDSRVLESLTFPLKDKDGFISLDISAIEKALSEKAAVAIGPGIGVNDDTVELVSYIVENSKIPVVIDADGINSLSKNLEVLRKKKTDIILTPHPGEMARLISSTPKDVQNNRLEVAVDFAKKFEVYVVLKGAGTIISTPEGKVYFNQTGNPGMASGGMGDVLTGLIGGFLAQGYEPWKAASLGVYIHGRAGDMASQKIGKWGFGAEELAGFIPSVISEILG
jgi:NAD(P)H-hydrate epimerase